MRLRTRQRRTRTTDVVIRLAHFRLAAARRRRLAPSNSLQRGARAKTAALGDAPAATFAPLLYHAALVSAAVSERRRLLPPAKNSWRSAVPGWAWRAEYGKCFLRIATFATLAFFALSAGGRCALVEAGGMLVLPGLHKPLPYYSTCCHLSQRLYSLPLLPTAACCTTMYIFLPRLAVAVLVLFAAGGTSAFGFSRHFCGRLSGGGDGSCRCDHAWHDGFSAKRHCACGNSGNGGMTVARL